MNNEFTEGVGEKGDVFLLGTVLACVWKDEGGGGNSEQRVYLPIFETSGKN
jgi:hypothetical protein